MIIEFRDEDTGKLIGTASFTQIPREGEYVRLLGEEDLIGRVKSVEYSAPNLMEGRNLACDQVEIVLADVEDCA